MISKHFLCLCVSGTVAMSIGKKRACILWNTTTIELERGTCLESHRISCRVVEVVMTIVSQAGK